VIDIRSVVVLAASLAVAPAWAHHSAAIFDTHAVVAFEGTVTKFSWTNPHAYIHVRTTDEHGEPVDWEIETDATPILTRSGWTPDSLAVGEKVWVRANPDRDAQRKHALLVSITTETGSTLAPRSYFLRQSGNEAIAGAKSLAGVWELGFADYGGFYEAWAAVPLTEKGLAAKAAYDLRTDSPEAQCIPMATPGVLVAPYLNEIVLGDDTILIRNERYNLERVVHMDQHTHPENGERTNQGHSIGWWEDGVLVVDTRYFADHRSQILGSGVPSSAAKHVIERFALSDDGTRIEISFVLEDPEYLREPFAGTVEWHYAPQFKMLGFNCDPEVSGRFQ
jgi:Family of unknown function (DUF6152)